LIDLLDANVWLPLSAPRHVHHDRALRYWEGEASDRAAFCRITSLALLRHLTSTPIMRQGLRTSAQAWDLYQQWLSLPEVLYLAEPARVDAQLGKFSRPLSLTPARWTDAYLAAFAIEADCRLVTFDRGFRDFRDLRFLELEA
jgi:toxin-antitoxin system PIN domain toxin